MGSDSARGGRLRSVDLARAAGISTQQVRNYEEAGVLPPAARTESGYRTFTPRHRAALLLYRCLVPGFGLVAAQRMMRALHEGEVTQVLALVEEGHAAQHRQRCSLGAASEALTAVARQAPEETARPRTTLRIGELAHQLGVRPSALRVWESAGLLVPRREPGTGYRRFGPAEIRDARLVALLRQSRYPLPQIRPVLDGLRRTGSTEALRAALARREEELTATTRAMLEGAGQLHAYLREYGPGTGPGPGTGA
ncbi:MerR family transcriptional regulator [Streptomyces albus]|uniref:MerR family transcriptional regulator n=1 Tax=Streptomyces albus TaxID=1888 RepID=UPI00370331C3